METLRDDDYPYLCRRAVRPLQVIIVGAGICGLSAAVALSQTGHSVTILESSPKVGEAGAGLQMAPNATRILDRLGLMDEVMEHMTILSRVSVRRWDSDAELGSTGLMPVLGHKYGAPMGVIHRGDLQRILLEAALKSGCHIVTSQAVVGVDARFRPQVQSVDGRTGCVRWFAGDVVIAADGIRSTVRRQMAKACGYPDEILATGDAAYRLLVPREKVKHNAELLRMLDQNMAVRYMGPGGHIMAYPLRQNSMFNMVLLHPDKQCAKKKQLLLAAAASTEPKKEVDDAWVNHGDRAEMLDFYGSWSPLIRSWLAHADVEVKVIEWPLKTLGPLGSWVRGSVALAGDACHPMLPYVAQGAANGIEDAAVLAMALTCTADVPLALGVYQAVRKRRAERIVASAAETRDALHLPDGPDQRARDEKIKHGSGSNMSGSGGGGASHTHGADKYECKHGRGGETGREADREGDGDQWRSSQWQDFVWGTDVMRTTIEKWDVLAGQVKRGRRV